VSDERPQPEHIDPAPGEVTAQPGGTAVTAGGYAYEVVADSPAAPAPAPKEAPAERTSGRGVPGWLVAVVAVLTAIAGALLTWAILTFLFGDEGADDDARVSANVANIINAFTQGQATGTIERFEGELPPGFPEDIPTYTDAEIVSSLAQLGGDDVLFLAVYDTDASRDDVAAYFREELDSGDFQIDALQDGREAALIQFSKTDDADVSGLVLVGESKDQDVTTVFYSVEVISGADDVDLSPFAPRVSRPLPADYPSEVPQYPDGVVVETVTQRESQGDIFGLAFITRDTTASVLDFYREQFEDKGWTVTEADASGSELEDAEGINFESEDGGFAGSVIAGVFAEDRNYTRAEMQIQVVE
jgi:hypothetical protein